MDSFGVPLIVVCLMVLWLDRRGITPPPFIAWTLGAWTVIDAVVLLLTPWPILTLANILLLVGARQVRRRDNPAADLGGRWRVSPRGPKVQSRGYGGRGRGADE